MLKAGDTADASINWTVPQPAGTVYVVIDLAKQIAESDESNNQQSLVLSNPDLHLEYISGSVLRDGSVYVIVRVTNRGGTYAPATNLAMWPLKNPGLQPLATVVVSSLRAGTVTDTVIELPIGSHPGGEVSYRLSLDDAKINGDADQYNNEVLFTLRQFSDADGDGIPEDWEVANGLRDTDPNDANADADGDGFTNWQEYIAGTDPRDPNSRPRVTEATVVKRTDGTGSTFTVSWASVPGHFYQVERSLDLETWTVAADEVQATPPLNTFTDDLSPSPERIFYRIVSP